jgi:hypothetical protein
MDATPKVTLIELPGNIRALVERWSPDIQYAGPENVRAELVTQRLYAVCGYIAGNYAIIAGGVEPWQQKQ